MPYYTNTEPDSFNLDTLLFKHGDKLRIVTCNKNAKNLKVLSNNFNPQQCTDKEGFHFFTIPRQPTIITCFCKKYHTYFASKTLTIQSNLPIVSLTSTEASSSGMEIDFNINIYNNLSKKHSLDPNALTLKNQQLGFPAHLQCLHQLKLKPTQQQKPLTSTTRPLPKKHTKEKGNDQDRLPKNPEYQPKSTPNEQNQQKTRQNKEPNPKTSKYKGKDIPKTSHNTAASQLDWFTNFPITLEMKQYDKLSTKLAQQLFFSIKPYLKEFTPGQPIKTSNPNTPAKLNQNKCKKLLPSSYTSKSIALLKQCSNETRKCALFHLHTCNQNTCDLSLPKDDHNLKSLSSHYFKDSFNSFLALEVTPGKAWIFPDLETELFNPNQPNSATFSKPTPITQLRELAAKTAKKFAEENQVTETTERHTHYFYCYLKAYLKAAANNDGIKEMDCDKALQH
ncbi:6108_t:CDS:2, partial [Gigaspora margarita]